LGGVRGHFTTTPTGGRGLHNETRNVGSKRGFWKYIQHSPGQPRNGRHFLKTRTPTVRNPSKKKNTMGVKEKWDNSKKRELRVRRFPPFGSFLRENNVREGTAQEA